MDNGFGDDDGLRQARSRRRFQTGLLIFLLLFFMDAKTPQETQQKKRAAQAKRSENDRNITGNTVDKLVDRLRGDVEHAPQGPFYHLRDQSSIKGNWHRAEGEEFQTLVPAMKEKIGSKHQDLRNETIAPSETGTVHFKFSHMTAALVPSKGNDVSTVRGQLKLGSSVTKSGPDAVFEGLFFHKYGHMSAVVGALGGNLKLVWNPAAGEAEAEASPLTGAAPVPDDNVGRLAMGSNSHSGNGTAAAAATATATATTNPGGGSSGKHDSFVTVGTRSAAEGVAKEDEVEVEAETEEGEEDEKEEEEGGKVGDASGAGAGEEAGEGTGGGQGGGNGRRERALKGLAVEGGEVGGGVGAQGGLGRLERATGSTEQVAAAASAGSGGDVDALGGWVWSEKGVGGAVDRSGRAGGSRSESSHEASPAAPGDEQAPAGGGISPSLLALLPRHPDTSDEAGAATRYAESPSAAEKATGDTGVVELKASMVELEASMTGEAKGDNPAAVAAGAASPEADGGGGKAEATGAGAGTGVLTREFPAWVLPKATVLEAGQDSGPLPTQWSALKKEYTQGCQFLLTLQTVEGEEADVHAEDEPKADLMRGEMVGINCNFSVVVEFQMSDSLLRNAQSQSMSYSVALTMVCLLQMCLLCCRVGLMLAQRRYGRNFMVPRRFQPPKFDYHRPIPPELAEQAQTQTAGGQHSEETRDIEAGNLLECAICYAAVDSALEDYMLTPCDHVFHQGCLTRWMDIKMECPTCRRELPPQLERSAS